MRSVVKMIAGLAVALACLVGVVPLLIWTVPAVVFVQHQRAVWQVGRAVENPPAEAVEELRWLIREGNEVTQSEALHALEDHPEQVQAALPELVEALAGTYGRGTDAKTATSILLGLGPAAAPGVPRLVEVLTHGEPFWRREQAAEVLGAIGPGAREAIPSLAEVAVADTDDRSVRDELRHLAAFALVHGDPSGEEAIPALERATEAAGEPAQEAARAIRLLLEARTKPPAEEVAQLRRMIREEELPSKTLALAALERYEYEPDVILTALPELVGVIKGQYDPIYLDRDDAAAVLKELGPAAAPAVPRLIEALRIEDFHTGARESRILAAEVLGAIGPAARPAVPALGEVATSDHNSINHDSIVRLRAVEALPLVDPLGDEAIPYLEDAAHAEPEEVREALAPFRHDDYQKKTARRGIAEVEEAARAALDRIAANRQQAELGE